MMTQTDQSERMLHEYLQKSGFYTSPIDGKRAWNCFKEFGNQAFECLEDLLLWETGMYSYKDQRYFHCSMVRQYTHAQYMEQLHMEIHIKPDHRLSSLTCELWSEDYKDLPAFYQAVERSDSFIIPFEQHPAFGYKLYFEQV